MTRIPPVPAPPRTSRPAPAIPPAPTPDRQGTYAAHTYGAFGPGGGGTSFVGNAAYHNNTYGGQAVLLNRSGASTSPTTHQTAVTVSGFRV